MTCAFISNYACDTGSPHICTSRPHAGDIIAVTDGISCYGAMITQSIPSTASTAQAMKILLIQSSTPTTSDSPVEATQRPTDTIGKGSKIAIGVVVPVAVFLIGTALFYLLRRRKRRHVHSTPDAEVLATRDGSNSAPKAELQGSTGAAIYGQKGTVFEKPELDNTQLGTTTTVSELAATMPGNEIQELHGNISGANLNNAAMPSSELQTPTSDDIAREAQQTLAKHSIDQDPGSAVTGLWDWSNFNTLGEPDESTRNSITGIRK